MRRLGLVLGLAAFFCGRVSSASGGLVSFVEHERATFARPSTIRLRRASPAFGGSPATTLAADILIGGARSTLDCVHAVHDITLDPASGVMSATLDLTVRANGGPLTALAFSFDQGLALGSAEADGRAVTTTDSVATPERTVQVSFDPPLADGESTTLHVAYGGTLACATYPDTGALLCAKGDDFSYFSHPSVFPFLTDPVVPEDATFDPLTRDITLRVPGDVDVVATGEHVSDVTASDGTHVSTWTIDQPLSRAFGLYVFAGKLGTMAVAGRAAPTTLLYPDPADDVDTVLGGWSAPALDWVESLTGAPLPFTRSMTLVRLPAALGDPGTATYGMTLLSDTYEQAGALMHEETWAHENTHLFWGIVVPEANPDESRLMTEGVAVLSELDYTFQQHFAGQDRDQYIARRFVPMAVDLRTQGASLPPVVLGPGQPLPDAFRTTLYTLWAYYKTSAVLDHLRVSIGEDVFSRALAAYVGRCSYVGCRPSDFADVLAQTTGRDLQPFWDRWVTADSRPTVTVTLRPSAPPGQGGADVDLAKDDDAPMTLELWITSEDGQRVKQRVDLVGRVTTVHVSAASGVRSVMPSPRHDVLVDAEPAVVRDLDFDGEVDGFDILRCSRLVGTAYAQEVGALGLWNVDEEYDPRCDRNGDLRIDDADIADIASAFGTLRAAP